MVHCGLYVWCIVGFVRWVCLTWRVTWLLMSLWGKCQGISRHEIDQIYPEYCRIISASFNPLHPFFQIHHLIFKIPFSRIPGQRSFCVCPANERRRYNVTSSLIGWAHTQNDPCSPRMACIISNFQKLINFIGPILQPIKYQPCITDILKNTTDEKCIKFDKLKTVSVTIRFERCVRHEVIIKT